jgi:uncharacterized protein YchJ
MPTPRPKHRTYCKTCEDFTVHSADYVCEDCNTEFTSYFPSEVEPILIKQQRERYKQSKLRRFRNTYTSFLNGYGIEAMLSSLENTPQIVECDAGEKEIEQEKKERRLRLAEERQRTVDDYNTNYKHLGRNDKCTCGSDKKYKQCHLIIFREKGLKL